MTAWNDCTRCQLAGDGDTCICERLWPADHPAGQIGLFDLDPQECAA